MSRSSVVLVLVALVVGGAVGYGLGRGSTPPVIPAAIDADVRRPEPAPKAPVDAAVPGAANSTLAQVLATLPEPEVPVGHGVITGRVVTSAGDPVPGVRLRARRSHGLPWTSAGRELTLEETVRGFVARHQYGRMTSRDAVSDREGAYRLEGLTDDEHSITGLLEGYRVRPAGRSWKARPGDEFDLVADPVARVEFVVTRPDGTSPAEAEIHTEKDGRRASRLPWEPRVPHRDLEPGAWMFRAEAEGGALVSDPVTLNLIAGAGAVRVALPLLSRSGIRGRVVYPDGVTGQYLSVHLYRASPEGEPDATSLRRDREVAHEGLRGSGDVAYAFPKLEPGRYVLALVTNHDPVALVAVMVADRMIEQDIVVPEPDPAEYVLLRVLAPDGEDAGDVRISTSFHGAAIVSSGGGRVERLADGRWRVYHHRVRGHETLPEGRDTIEVRSEAHGQKLVEYRRGTDRELTVRLEEPAVLRVTVSGAAGSGFEADLGVSLILRMSASSYRSFGGAGKTDAEGRWVFEGQAPGDYEIRLTLRPGEYESMLLASAPVTLVPGVVDRTVALPRLHALVVDPGDIDERLSLMAIDDVWTVRLGPLEGGRLGLPGVPAGSYFLMRRTRSTNELMPIRIPAPGVIRFEPKEANAIRLLQVERDGYLARAGLRNGDLIVGIDGHRFELFAAAEKAFYAKRTGPVRLSVRRGGRVREMTVDLRPVTDGGERPGATLRGGLAGE